MEAESTQQAQIRFTLTNNSSFEDLLWGLMSQNEEQKAAAEIFFNRCEETDLNSLSTQLVNIIDNSQHINLRSKSSLLLRKLLSRSGSYLWPTLSPDTQFSLKSTLPRCIRRNKYSLLTKNLCQTVSELALLIVPVEGWDELLAVLSDCVESDSSLELESALLIFGQLSECLKETFILDINYVNDILLKVMGSSHDPDVKIAALNASINFVRCLSTLYFGGKFKSLLPKMIAILAEALSRNEARGHESLAQLIDLAKRKPRFLGSDPELVVGSMLQILESKNFGDATRHLAVELVITLANASKGAAIMMRRISPFVGRLFPILMEMLLDVEDDPDMHIETSKYSAAKKFLDRLATSVGGETTGPEALEEIEIFLVTPVWMNRHAALVALTQIAKGCSKVMIKNLDHVVTMALCSFDDPHYRVRWAAINAIGELSKHLGLHLQNRHQHRVLSLLSSAMDDHNPLVQAHAASAVLHFSKYCSPEVLRGYLDSIAVKSLVLLKGNEVVVREGALNALVSVIEMSQNETRSKVVLSKGTRSRKMMVGMAKISASQKKLYCKLKKAIKLRKSLVVESEHKHWTQKLDSLEQLAVCSLINSCTLLGGTMKDKQKDFVISNMALACASFAVYVFRKIVPKKYSTIDHVLVLANLLFAVGILLWLLFGLFGPSPSTKVCPIHPPCPFVTCVHR